MALFVSKGVLMTEEVRPTAIAMTEREHGHEEAVVLASDLQFNLAPIKLTMLSRIVIDADESLLIRLVRTFGHFADEATDC